MKLTINKVKSYFIVNKVQYFVASLCLTMILLGGIGGYGIGKIEGENKLLNLQNYYTERINRMQANHTHVVTLLSSKLVEVVDKRNNKDD